MYLVANHSVSPYMNPAVNPSANPDVHLALVNPSANPSVNQAVNPSVNPSENPAVNPTVNDSVNLGGCFFAACLPWTNSIWVSSFLLGCSCSFCMVDDVAQTHTTQNDTKKI